MMRDISNFRITEQDLELGIVELAQRYCGEYMALIELMDSGGLAHIPEEFQLVMNKIGQLADIAVKKASLDIRKNLFEAEVSKRLGQAVQDELDRLELAGEISRKPANQGGGQGGHGVGQ